MIIDFQALIFSLLLTVFTILGFVFVLGLQPENRFNNGISIVVLIFAFCLCGYCLLSESFYTQESLSFDIVENSNYGIIENSENKITFNVRKSNDLSKTETYSYVGDIQYKKSNENKAYVTCITRTYLFHNESALIEDINIYSFK